MSIFIRRKKLFEEGEQTAPAQSQQTQGTAQNADTTQQAGQNAAPTQQSQPAPSQTSTQQPQQPAQQQPQQPQQEQKPDPKAEELNKKVTDCVNSIKSVIEKNDPYALIAYDVPSVMQQMVPEFTKDNADAKNTMDAWGKFKSSPSKDSFDAMINAFVLFGNGGKTSDNAQQTQQQVQPQAPATPEANSATSSQQQSESLNKTFSDRLNERLQHNVKMSRYQSILEKYWKQPESQF